MDYTKKHLEKLLKVKWQTIKTYLDRSEFSHIKQKHKKDNVYLTNITDVNLIRLEYLTSSRKTVSKNPTRRKKNNLDIKQAKKILINIKNILKKEDLQENEIVKIILIENEIKYISEYL